MIIADAGVNRINIEENEVALNAIAKAKKYLFTNFLFFERIKNNIIRILKSLIEVTSNSRLTLFA